MEWIQELLAKEMKLAKEAQDIKKLAGLKDLALGWQLKV